MDIHENGRAKISKNRSIIWTPILFAPQIRGSLVEGYPECLRAIEKVKTLRAR